ncbi:MAG: large subunit ribosomal protein L4 [Parcubacteria group bacterium Gr01-1014_19]|nr:MAG: large subunit ribosomal protein L4 [Parcubacteria group bacterium Gr01-1014_19]
MKTSLYNLKGESIGEVDLPEKVFGSKWNPDLVHQVLMAQAANRRSPWAHAKGRGEVRGGGVKPWKQKHTGRARHGSIRSPIWKGGGVSHGPKKDRDYTQKVNKKMAKAAVFSVLSKKLAEGELRVVDSLELQDPKTKALFTMIKNMLPAVLVATKENKNISRASKNLARARSLSVTSLNVEDLLKYKNILLDQRAVTEIK